MWKIGSWNNNKKKSSKNYRIVEPSTTPLGANVVSTALPVTYNQQVLRNIKQLSV